MLCPCFWNLIKKTKATIYSQSNKWGNLEVGFKFICENISNFYSNRTGQITLIWYIYKFNIARRIYSCKLAEFYLDKFIILRTFVQHFHNGFSLLTTPNKIPPKFIQLVSFHFIPSQPFLVIQLEMISHASIAQFIFCLVFTNCLMILLIFDDIKFGCTTIFKYLFNQQQKLKSIHDEFKKRHLTYLNLIQKSLYFPYGYFLLHHKYKRYNNNNREHMEIFTIHSFMFCLCIVHRSVYMCNGFQNTMWKYNEKWKILTISLVC